MPRSLIRHLHTATQHELAVTVPVSVHIFKLHFPNLIVNSFRAGATPDGSFYIPEHQPKALPIIRVGQRLIDR